MQAIRNPGTRVKWRRIMFAYGKMAGVPVLQMRLPSGHLLTYPKARIVTATKDFGNGPRKIDQIEFWGKHPTKEAWCWVQTYGGKLLENATQAVGGNFMTHGLLVAEKRGMEPFATIHDQALAVQRPGQTADMFREALTVLPPWAEGFPLAADCGVVNYYTKD